LVNKISFLYLTAFSKTGGIEQFNKNIIASLHQLNIESDIISVYDEQCVDYYSTPKTFKGFGGKKIKYLLSLLSFAKKYNVFIIGHINLAWPVYLIKILNPTAKIILIAHGVEVWEVQKKISLWLLKTANFILAVSNYTKSRLLNNNPSIEIDKIKILPNAVDPFFSYPTDFARPDYLLKRYNVKENEKIVLTIARLSSEEQYKGYDLVINSLKKIINDGYVVKYLIVGKADNIEFERINNLIVAKGLTESVILTGFIPLNELVDHYLLAEIFVLPSSGEGFGIVFIEALACGLKVIAGNKDGSVDALLNGKLGALVDPQNPLALSKEIIHSLNLKVHSNEIQLEMKKHFSFPVFKENVLRLFHEFKIID
jgi:glycosyltransferase involved in cell wall biosynthesis